MFTEILPIDMEDLTAKFRATVTTNDVWTLVFHDVLVECPRMHGGHFGYPVIEKKRVSNTTYCPWLLHFSQNTKQDTNYF